MMRRPRGDFFLRRRLDPLLRRALTRLVLVETIKVGEVALLTVPRDQFTLGLRRVQGAGCGGDVKVCREAVAGTRGNQVLENFLRWVLQILKEILLVHIGPDQAGPEGIQFREHVDLRALRLIVARRGLHRTLQS